MASSAGPRARGTDGSDFSKREGVAGHYKKSAEFKKKLKRILLFQIICALMCLSVGLIAKYDFTCLLSFSGYACGLPFGYLALKYNNPSYMNIYGCCCSILGVFPMVYLLYTSLWSGVVDQYRYVRLAMALMVVFTNTTGMFFAKTLMDAWTVNTRR